MRATIFATLAALSTCGEANSPHSSTTSSTVPAPRIDQTSQIAEPTVSPPAVDPSTAPSAFATKVQRLETWLVGHPGVDRVASWPRRDRFSWVRDDRGSTFCSGNRCWREDVRPDLISILVAGKDSPSAFALRLAWGSETGSLAVWEFDAGMGSRQLVGEILVRAGKPSPFWWNPKQIELAEPGQAWTMSATAPPTFMVGGLTPRGPHGPSGAWPTIPLPDWMPLLEELDIWPYRSSSGVMALAVSSLDAEKRADLAVCVSLRRWHCAPLDHRSPPFAKQAPVRAEALGADAIVVEFAELLDDSAFLGRAEVHILALDSKVQTITDIAAITNGGISGTMESVGTYRRDIELDYRFVRRAYQPWEIVGTCLQVGPLAGEDLALDGDFGVLDPIEIRAWRERAGKPMPKPLKPTPLTPEAARTLILETAVPELAQRHFDPRVNPQGQWRVVDGTLLHIGPDVYCDR